MLSPARRPVARGPSTQALIHLVTRPPARSRAPVQARQRGVRSCRWALQCTCAWLSSSDRPRMCPSMIARNREQCMGSLGGASPTVLEQGAGHIEAVLLLRELDQLAIDDLLPRSSTRCGQERADLRPARSRRHPGSGRRRLQQRPTARSGGAQRYESPGAPARARRSNAARSSLRRSAQPAPRSTAAPMSLTTRRFLQQTFDFEPTRSGVLCP